MQVGGWGEELNKVPACFFSSHALTRCVARLVYYMVDIVYNHACHMTLWCPCVLWYNMQTWKMLWRLGLLWDKHGQHNELYLLCKLSAVNQVYCNYADMSSSQHTVYIVVYSILSFVLLSLLWSSCPNIICFLCVVHKLTTSFIRGSHFFQSVS